MIVPHPTRTRLFRLIRERGGATLSEIQQATGLSRSALRQHLTVLERDGLIRERVVRARTGRPPILYELAPAAARGSVESYLTLLSAIFRALGADGRERLGRIAVTVAADLAVRHEHVTGIPDPVTRIRAALAGLLDNTAAGDVRQVGPDYEVILHTCPLAPIAREFPELCEISRRLLAALVGAEVAQRESIVRGDPRCTFTLRLAPLATPLLANTGRTGHG